VKPVRFGRLCGGIAVAAFAALAPVIGLTATPAGAVTPSIVITEVAPWGSGTATYAADWFELTNTGGSAVNITGWKMDDNSDSFALAVPLAGVTSIAPGQSVIFIEGTAATAATFTTTWFGASPPSGFTIGSYTGSGVGLSTTSDAVNIFDSTGAAIAGVTFGAADSTNPLQSFDNTAGVNGAISTLSTTGTNGAFVAANDSNEIGSPGTIGTTNPILPEVPYAILLPGGAVVVLAGGIAVSRRRRRPIAA
jgi:hypothetical protein